MHNMHPKAGLRDWKQLRLFVVLIPLILFNSFFVALVPDSWLLIEVFLCAILFLILVIKGSILESLSLVFVLGLPLHTFAMKVIQYDLGVSGTALTVISSWKDILLLFLLVTFFVSKFTLKLKRNFLLLDLGIIVFIFLSLFYVFVSPTLLHGFYGFRGTVEPLFVYIFFRYRPLSYSKRRRLCKMIITLGSILAIFAVYQAFQWTRSNYTHYGYTNVYGEMYSTFNVVGFDWLRPTSTFSSANTAGLFFVISMVLAIKYMQLLNPGIERNILFFKIGCLILGIIVTLSRSSWLAAGISLMIIFAESNPRFRKRLVGLGIFTIFILILFFLFSNELSSGVVNRFLMTIGGNERSALSRLPDTKQALLTIFENPLGVGLGIVGARSGKYVADYYLAYHTENYFLQLFIEMGIIGGGLHILLYFVSLFLVWRHRNSFSRGNAFDFPTVFAILTSIFVANIFIPQLNELVLAGYLWMFIGIYAQETHFDKMRTKLVVTE